MEILATLCTAIIAATITYFVSNRDLSDSLDSKSGWREKLFKVASTYELTLDDAQTVRAALRLFPNQKKSEVYSFTWFSNIMIVHLDKYILNRDYKNLVVQTGKISEAKTLLNPSNTDIVRLFAVFLLKHHFDYRSSMGAKDYIFLAREDKTKKFNPIVQETYGRYIKLLEYYKENR